MIIKDIQQIIFGKLLHFIKFSRHIQNIFRFQHSIRFGKFLSDSLQKTVLRSISTTDFHNIKSIFTTNIQIEDGLSQKAGVFNHLHTEQITGKTIFIHQLFQRLTRTAVIIFLPFFRKKPLTKRHQNQRTDSHTHQTYRQESKERKRFEACGSQCVLYDKVGRCTDQRHHTSHTTGKGQRHQQPTRIHFGAHRQTDHNGKHQCHRSGITDKRTDSGSDQHNKEEQANFTVSSKFKDTRTYHFCQSCLKNSSAHDKQSDHHNDYRIGETGKGFVGC